MPARDDLPGTIRRSPKKAQETWAKTHDAAVETYGEGERAHRTAFSALKHSFEKVGDNWEPKDVKGPSDPQAAQGGRAARDRPRTTYGGVDAVGNTRDELLALFAEAARLKAARVAKQPTPLLAGRVLALVFDKPSLRTRVSFQAAMAPGIAEGCGQLGMQIEAPARQLVQSAAAAPVVSDESTRLARGRARHRMTLDHDRLCAASCQEVGGGAADRATAADDDTFGRAHGRASAFNSHPP